MRKIISLILAMGLLVSGCGTKAVLQDTPRGDTTTAPTQVQPQPTEAIPIPEPTETEPEASSEPSAQTVPEGSATEPAEPFRETVPSSRKPTEPKPTEPKPTEPRPTEPRPTEPKPTEPKPTEPKPTEPRPTEPRPTEPEPTQPTQTEPTQPPTVTEEDPDAILAFAYPTLELDLENNAYWYAEYCYTGRRELVWSSSDPEVACVDDWGCIDPRSFGKTVITVTDGVLSAQCEVIVKGVTILTPERTRIGIGESLQLEYEYTGDPVNLKWKSRDPSIVSVDQSGVVTGVSAGAELISVYDGEVSYCICIVVVSEDNLAERMELSALNSPLYDGIVKYAGDYMTFTVRTRPYGVNPKVNVSVDNTDVLSDSNNYSAYYEENRIRLEFKKAGTATVTISSADGAVTETYRIVVKSEFDCYPGKEQLTPGEFAYYASQVGGELGQTVSYTLSGYRWLYVSDADLTWERAKGVGKSLAHEWYSIGINNILVTYAGWSEEHNKHLFYVGY